MAALFPSAAVAPRSFVAGRASFWCSRCFGYLEFLSPSTDLSRRWIRLLTLKWKMMLSFSMASIGQGVGSLEPVFVDYPAVEGPLHLKASKGAVAAARRRRVFVVDLVGIQKDPFVSSFFHLDLSVMFGI